MRVEPPTSTASSISAGSRPASASAWRHGLERPLDERTDQLLELGARDARGDSPPAARSDGSTRISVVVLLGEIALGLDDRLADRLDQVRSGAASACTTAMLQVGPAESRRAPARIEQPVDVVAAEVRVAVGRRAPGTRRPRPSGSRCRTCRRRGRRPRSCRGSRLSRP